MKLTSLRRLAVLGATAAVIGAGPAAAEPVGRQTLLGEPAAADAPVDKVIRINADTRSVNVMQDETVKFVVRESSGIDQSFAWRFTSPRFAINLARVAPQGMLDHRVEAYLSPDPLYDDE